MFIEIKKSDKNLTLLSLISSVKALDTPSVKVGSTITLTLMKRERGSTMSMPAYQWKPIEKPLNVADEDDLCFAKLLSATPQQVLNMVEMEKDALLRQMEEDGKEVRKFCWKLLKSSDLYVLKTDVSNSLSI